MHPFSWQEQLMPTPLLFSLAKNLRREFSLRGLRTLNSGINEWVAFHWSWIRCNNPLSPRKCRPSVHSAPRKMSGIYLTEIKYRFAGSSAIICGPYAGEVLRESLVRFLDRVGKSYAHFASVPPKDFPGDRLPNRCIRLLDWLSAGQ